MLIDVTSDDAGLYTCSVLKNYTDSESYQDYVYVHVRVRTRPGDKINNFMVFIRSLHV